MCSLANALKPANCPNIDLEVGEFDDIAEYLCVDNLTLFLDVCKNQSNYWKEGGFGVPEDILFTPEQLNHFSVENFTKVFDLFIYLSIF